MYYCLETSNLCPSGSPAELRVGVCEWDVPDAKKGLFGHCPVLPLVDQNDLLLQGPGVHVQKEAQAQTKKEVCVCGEG